MPVIKPIDIVSFSSEDPNNPASNLLSPDTFRKWKCKDPGEGTAFVILKFEKAVNFLAINFGNEFSAFVEIFVARSGSPDPQFHSFVSQTALMSANESRIEENGNRVKMLTVDKFNKKLASEKWDLVKVVCSQQFNNRIQFGLAYIEFVTPGDPNEKPKVGGFSMLPKALGEDELSGSTSSGRLFAQRLQQKSGSSPINNNTSKTNSPNSASAAATIRQTSTSLANAAIASCEERVKELKKRKLGSKSTDDEEEDDKRKGKFNVQESESESESESDSQSKKPINKANGSSSSSSTAPKPAKKYKRVYSQDDDEDEEDESNRSRVKPVSSKVSKSVVPIKKTTKKKQIKPFNKLFDDVIFVMSGYVNPKRANIRRKAEKMGAKCKHDWESNCTHLICAFVNTPKFREVRQSGHGKIVREDWIEKSYDARIRFPWRRFCLDRNDRGDESEDEIYAEDSEEEEEEAEPRAGPSASSQKQSQETSRADDEGTNSAEKNKSSIKKSQDTKTEQNNNDDDVVLSPVKKKRKAIESDEEDGEEGKASKSSNKLTEKETKAKSSKKDDGSDTPDPDDAYNADTDVENDVNEGGTSDFFKEKVFYLHLNKQVPAAKKKLQKSHIEQMILRHKGKIETDMTEQVEYVVTDLDHWDEHFAEALLKNPKANVVRFQWVIECERENELTSTENFLILPDSDDQAVI